ncbi:MAG: flavohemoglobin expression-modulating QEGLA motif protein, partial [Sphingomicrobium sp.]
LSISPIDTSRAYERFVAGNGREPPRFNYRPLAVDPDSAKRDLYAIDLAQLEDPLLEMLLSEKRREIDAQLTMLATRNTPAFRPASMVLYGTVDEKLLADAETILASTGDDPPRGIAVGAEEAAVQARDLIARYHAIDPRFAAMVEIRDDVSGLMVSRDKLMIGRDSVMPAHRVTALLAHEVSVHLLTYFNGAAQGLGIFATGLAGYEGVQEGLGVFAEWASGGLTRARLRLLAGRVAAVHAMQQGAEFIDCYRLLRDDHGFTRRSAFGITARVYRSGGLAKDAIYLKGFRRVIDMVVDERSLAPFWLGKIAPRHVAAIEELLLRGLVHPPVFTPLFLAEEGTKKRIARLRDNGQLTDLLND